MKCFRKSQVHVQKVKLFLPLHLGFQLQWSQVPACVQHTKEDGATSNAILVKMFTKLIVVNPGQIFRDMHSEDIEAIDSLQRRPVDEDRLTNPQFNPHPHPP